MFNLCHAFFFNHFQWKTLNNYRCIREKTKFDWIQEKKNPVGILFFNITFKLLGLEFTFPQVFKSLLSVNVASL